MQIPGLFYILTLTVEVYRLIKITALIFLSWTTCTYGGCQINICPTVFLSSSEKLVIVMFLQAIK